MKVHLCIPRPPVPLPGGGLVKSKSVYRFPLRWTAHDPASHYGIGVLLDQKNEVVDGFMFAHLRDTVGAWLESDDMERVRGCLGLGAHERIEKLE